MGLQQKCKEVAASQTIKTVLEFFAKMEVKPGDWVVAKKGKHKTCAKGDVGKIVGIKVEDGTSNWGKMKWVVKWYYANKGSSRYNGEHTVKFSVNFAKLQGDELDLMKTAQEIVDEKKRSGDVDPSPIQEKN